LKHCIHIEAYLAPLTEEDWIAAQQFSPEDGELGLRQELLDFKVICNRWLAAVSLPVDQLILSLGVDIFTDPSDLALVHKLALVLRQAVDVHTDWRINEITEELASIAKNERRFIGFSKDESGFDPGDYPGKVVVTTMHKAKGLEWDRVYLLSLNNYDFPSNLPHDQFISEKNFIRDHLNLEAEALDQMQAVLSSGEFDGYAQGIASSRARVDYSRERLRLLFVGVTRARKELILTWNTGRQGDASAALGFAAINEWWTSMYSST
jgi:DNA helicase-2/ATP-dependent DNA helicase PcrA